MIEKYEIDPKYTKNNGLWLFNTDSLDVPSDFTIGERNIVYIPAGEYGGNHKHPRTEAFIGIGDGLELVWEDNAGQKHVEQMASRTAGKLKIFLIHPMTPHVVMNRGKNASVLIEFADGPQHAVEPASILDIPS